MSKQPQIQTAELAEISKQISLAEACAKVAEANARMAEAQARNREAQIRIRQADRELAQLQASAV
jgi:hypothetical protein